MQKTAFRVAWRVAGLELPPKKQGSAKAGSPVQRPGSEHPQFAPIQLQHSDLALEAHTVLARLPQPLQVGVHVEDIQQPAVLAVLGGSVNNASNGVGPAGAYDNLQQVLAQKGACYNGSKQPSFSWARLAHPHLQLSNTPTTAHLQNLSNIESAHIVHSCLR